MCMNYKIYLISITSLLLSNLTKYNNWAFYKMKADHRDSKMIQRGEFNTKVGVSCICYCC